VATYDLQEKCARDAYGLYKREWVDAESNPGSSYTNHYNAQLEKCFIVVTSFLLGKQSSVHKTLLDVLENREMGTLDKITGDVPPYQCEITGTKCASLAEWDALTKPYREDAIDSHGR
jgi:hypothetical protein